MANDSGELDGELFLMLLC